MAYLTQVVNDAYHEAAHAVFYHHAGLTLTELYVYGEGKVRVEWPTAPSPEQALQIAAGCLAGPLSWYALHGQEINPLPFEDFVEEADFAGAAARAMEEMGFDVNPDELRAIRPPEVGDDLEDALAMLEIAGQARGGVESCYEEALRGVYEGLEAWWPKIGAVAKALMESRRLDGADVASILQAEAR